MTKRIVARIFQGACIIYMGLVAEAGAAATPKVIACLNACATVQLACAQPTLNMPAEQRTIKDVNTPPPKGGGFELRLKAGLVRLWRT